MALLGKLGYIECQDAVNFIMKCKNFDEAFGVIPGAESHAGQSLLQTLVTNKNTNERQKVIVITWELTSL